MESSRDQTRAFMYAVGVHVLAALVMFAGLLASPPKKPVISGGALEAVLVDMNIGRPLPKPAVKPTPKPAPAPTPPAPKPDPVKEPIAKPEPAPPPPPPQAKPDDVTDQRPQLPAATQPDALNLERQREELRLQQEELRRQQEIEQQRQQQLDDIRRQRAEAARQTQAEEQRLARAQEAQRADQILNQATEPTREPEGSQRPGQDVANDLLSQYAGLIQEVVTQNWRRPANTPAGIRCSLRVRQIPGGEVIGVTVGSPCNADPLIQQSIIEAVERASPLPYMGFESVFQSSLNFNFRYDG